MAESTKLNYIDNGDDTVSDTKHGIMWMKNDTWLELGRLITWHDSLELARKKNEEKFAGHEIGVFLRLRKLNTYSIQKPVIQM
ncbi:MAG: hypothetical protein Ct9H300mP23_06400 [Nitrospinota bacterium]|nr:MAG: hypothetical protein Ct9H300mP23_06400 [Nitrospinota bacterium]